MEKREIERDKIRLLSQSETTGNFIYKTDENEILKIFSPYYMNTFEYTNRSLEERILTAKQDNDGIVVPTAAAYRYGKFVGYFMHFINGVTDTYLDKNLPIEKQLDLSYHAKMYLKLEKIIKDSPNIVVPDLLTTENIIIDENGEIKLIDYDGMQVDDAQTVIISDLLDEVEIYNNKKYIKSEGIYTKQLDIKSLIHWYFLGTFHANLGKIGEYNPYVGQFVTLDDFFRILNFDDYDIMQKVWLLFSEKKENLYLGKDVLRLAEDYEIKPVFSGARILKRK